MPPSLQAQLDEACRERGQARSDLFDARLLDGRAVESQLTKARAARTEVEAARDRLERERVVAAVAAARRAAAAAGPLLALQRRDDHAVVGLVGRVGCGCRR